MNGECKDTIKMCIKCHRLVPTDTLVCSDCGGILFLMVKLDREKHNG